MRELLVDSNEASTKTGSRVVKHFSEDGIPVAVESLPADYVFHDREGNTVCVERSTLSDFWGKLTGGRLFEQLFSELESCGRLYYAVTDFAEMYWFERSRGRSAVAQIEGALTAVSSAGAALAVIWRDDTFHAWLRRLFEREAGEARAVAYGRRVRKWGRSAWQVGIDVLTALPHIGGSTAERLLSECSNLADCFRRLATDARGFLARYLPLKRADSLAELLLEPLTGVRGSGQAEDGQV